MAVVPQPRVDLVRQFQEREFCDFGFQNDISCVPVDEDEDSLFNDHFHSILDARGIAIVPEGFQESVESPQVLDCGYGTGIWIDDFLVLMDVGFDEDSLVTGIDIFQRQNPDVQEFVPLRWNLNASFKNSPLEDEALDLINSRFLTDGINGSRWELMIQEYKELLKPRGWLQMAETRWVFLSQSGRDLPHLDAWSNAYADALRRMQKNPEITRDLERLVRWAGFEEVESQVHILPVQDFMPYVLGILESFALVPFRRHLGWDSARSMDVIQAAQTELQTPDAKITFELTVVYGRRPNRP